MVFVSPSCRSPWPQIAYMMMNNSKGGLPRWVWAAGCLGMLFVCGVVIIAVSATFLISELASGDKTTTVEPAVQADDNGRPAERGTEEPVLLPDVKRAQIEEAVVEIRGLQARQSVTPTFLSTGELRQRLEEDLAEDYPPEEARKDALTLSAFDFLEADFDLYSFLLDLLSEQIAGFYDSESDEFVIIGADDFGVLEQLTHAHEYVHALQDQHYDLDVLDDEQLSDDASLAMTAFVEGDATLVQMLYMTSGAISRQDLVDLLGEAVAIDTPVLESAPPFLANELTFPYTTGLEFVQKLYGEGGFAAVEQAWAEPPQSTEQIIHPERYLADDEPQLVFLDPLTDTLGIGWSLLDEDVLGEFYLREYLSQRLERSAVDVAATGWGGDRYAVYWHEDNEEIALVFRLGWDSKADAREFLDAYYAYPAALFEVSANVQPDGSSCWQGYDVICLYEVESDVLIIRAPDLAVARQIAAVQTP